MTQMERTLAGLEFMKGGKALREVPAGRFAALRPEKAYETAGF
jgi:hypothetical protein